MIGRLFNGAWRWLAAQFRPKPRPFALAYFEGDELPETLPERTLVVAREEGELWSAGLICPCGCGRRIELMLLPDVEPRWDVRIGKGGAPTLWPSVWAKTGCRSHFWLRDGEVSWCRDRLPERR
jgi:Family of unknown function (DUF6527)